MKVKSDNVITEIHKRLFNLKASQDEGVLGIFRKALVETFQRKVTVKVYPERSTAERTKLTTDIMSSALFWGGHNFRRP